MTDDIKEYWLKACGKEIIGVRSQSEATVFEIKGDVNKFVSISCQQDNKTFFLRWNRFNNSVYLSAYEDLKNGVQKFRLESGLSEGLVKFGKY